MHSWRHGARDGPTEVGASPSLMPSLIGVVCSSPHDPLGRVHVLHFGHSHTRTVTALGFAVCRPTMGRKQLCGGLTITDGGHVLTPVLRRVGNRT